MVEYWIVGGVDYDDAGHAIGYADLTLVYVPSLGDHALNGNTAMKYLVLANGALKGKCFAGSALETVVLKNMGTIGGAGDLVFADAPNLKNVWIGERTGSSWKIRDSAFSELADEMNFYFYDMTYDEVLALVGSDAWYTNADKKAHFYFKDTIPADVEWPEDIKSAE